MQLSGGEGLAEFDLGLSIPAQRACAQAAQLIAGRRQASGAGRGHGDRDGARAAVARGGLGADTVWNRGWPARPGRSHTAPGRCGPGAMRALGLDTGEWCAGAAEAVRRLARAHAVDHEIERARRAGPALRVSRQAAGAHRHRALGAHPHGRGPSAKPPPVMRQAPGPKTVFITWANFALVTPGGMAGRTSSSALISAALRMAVAMRRVRNPNTRRIDPISAKTTQRGW